MSVWNEATSNKEVWFFVEKEMIMDSLIILIIMMSWKIYVPINIITGWISLQHTPATKGKVLGQIIGIIVSILADGRNFSQVRQIKMFWAK